MPVNLEPFDLFADKVKIAMAKDVDDRRDSSKITMSSIGHCARQLAYRRHRVPGKDISWRALSIFEDGDYHHEVVRGWLARALNPEVVTKAGEKSYKSCYELIDEEREVEFCGIVGHIDGILKHDHARCPREGDEHKDYLLEVKSMNDRSFKETVRTRQMSWEYRCQVSAYLCALGLKYAIILLKNKNDSDMEMFRYTVEPSLVEQRFEKIDEVIASEDPESVAREYTPSDSGRLPWQCCYCPFIEICYRDFGLYEAKARKYTVDMERYLGKQSPPEDIPAISAS